MTCLPSQVRTLLVEDWIGFFAHTDLCASILGAIAEYPWWQPFLNQSEQEFQYYNALRLSGCDSVTCLRSQSIGTLATLNQAVQNASFPGPVSTRVPCPKHVRLRNSVR